jgi:hypothetical protein
VVAVDVALPGGFRLEKAADVGPWKVTQDGSTLRYRGGELPPYSCASFNLEGMAESQSKLAFSVTSRSQDGSEVRFDGTEADDPHAAQLVYAGFSPPALDEKGGSSWLSGSTLAVVATVAVVGAAYVFSRRGARLAPSRVKRPRGR